MRRKPISLNAAILTPFVTIMLATVFIFVLLLNYNYDWITREHGSKTLVSLSSNTKNRLNFLLSEPLRLSQMYADFITSEKLYKDADMERIEDFSLKFVKSLSKDLSQLSVLGYADESGNFIGIRMNKALNSYNLMLQDSRTNGKLNIYENENIASKLIASYDGFDPRTRPYYTPVKESPIQQWSEVYINRDEKMEATITTLIPIFNSKHNFHGVAMSDVKLNGINEFLRNDSTKGNGVIYIVDKNWKMVASSEEEPIMKATEGSNPSAEQVLASSSENTLVKQSAAFFKQNSYNPDKMVPISISGKRFFALVSKLEQPSELGWMVVAVIPETDLIGDFRRIEVISVIFSLFLALVGVLIGLWALKRMMRPITKSVEAAKQIANGNFDIKVDEHIGILHETNELISSFNLMVATIRDSFTKVQLSEEKYRSLIENIDDMIYSISKDKYFLSVNKSFEMISGRTRDELIGKHIATIFEDLESRHHWDKVADDVITNKEMFQTHLTLKGSDGRMKHMKMVLIPILDANKNVSMVLGSNTDITALVEAQQEIEMLHEKEKINLETLIKERTSELQLAMEELAEREKLASLGSLVSGISHEINTPLGVAVSAGSYISEIVQAAEEKILNNNLTKSDFIKFMKSLDETIVIINTNLLRAAELVKSFKQVAVNQTIEEASIFNVKDYVDAVILSLKHELKHRRQILVFNCEEDLVIKSYPGALSQILTNFIMNSLSHAYNEKDTGTMTLDIVLNHDNIIVKYSDDGKGIDPETLPRIFEPFFTTMKNKGGSGLGLYVVYNIVTSQLKGKISCSSELGKGTCFIIDIPVLK